MRPALPSSATAAPRRLSYRDPLGWMVQIGERVIRVLNDEGATAYADSLRSGAIQRRLKAGDIQQARVLTMEQAGAEGLTAGALRLEQPPALMLEHDRHWFPSFPTEWPHALLRAAAELTLDLSDDLLPDGWWLKDATPWNILFDGLRPVFVDSLSFQRRNPTDALWRPYGQFTRTFILPLLADRDLGLHSHEIFRLSSEGLEPERFRRLLRTRHLMRPVFLSTVVIPGMLAARTDGGAPKPVRDHDPQRAEYRVAAVFRHLRRMLGTARPARGNKSMWREYNEGGTHTPAYRSAKLNAVERVITAARPRTVLDVGCNVGLHALAAAAAGARVVAIDRDPAVISHLAEEAARQSAPILPLIVDLTGSESGITWAGARHPSFVDRAERAFDLVLALAVIHHMIILDRLPLADVASLMAGMTRRFLLVEYVPADDPQALSLAARTNEAAGYDRVTFDRAFGRHFELKERIPLPGTERELLLLELRR